MKGYLILADGTIFNGELLGAPPAENGTLGEAVCTTAMGGYMETLTDPSFFGQIIVHTFPLIGNYGAVLADCEAKKIWAAGVVVRELAQKSSGVRKECELNDFLIAQRVTAISGVDTRALARHLRDDGVMNAMISRDTNNLDAKLERIRAYKVQGAVEKTSCQKITTTGEGRRVVLWDFGAKLNIERELLKRGCSVITVPYNCAAGEITALKPDGIVLSNGGGNPADNQGVIAEIRKLLPKKIPMLGICLGHQLICLAAGAKTRKLKYGHRGANQPVKDLASGRVYITCQNHGYAVAASTLPEGAEVTMVSANDKTCEAVSFKDMPIVTAQFHPEACGGPHDAGFLFDRFLKLMK